MEWMKTPMKSDFSMLAGIIPDDLKAGHYIMQIVNGNR